MRLALGLTLLPALVWVSDAHADSLQGTRFEMLERSHAVALKVDRGFATLVVQRTVENQGPVSDQAVFHLDLPTGAVATRLRTSSAVNGTTTWFEGELMEAEAAAHKYEELTGIGGYYPKDPALLSWRSQRVLALQVFPVPKQSTKTVEYTLKIPLSYENGAYHAKLPKLGTEELAATVHATAAHPEDTLTVNGVSGASVTASGELDVVLSPHRTAPLETALSSTVLAHDRHLVHAQINTAAHIMEAPRAARVVVLFDGSRSHHDAVAALAGVRAYLGNMPDAVVDFLVFDRTIQAPFGRAVPVATALAKLATYQPKLGNGSALDDALLEADRVLSASPAAAKRVVVVTDTLTRSALTPEKLGALKWQSGAVVHIASVTHGGSWVTRDDDSPWATLPRRTGGLFWNASATGVDRDTRVAFEELARPKRLDKVVVKGLSGPADAPLVLEEGAGFDHFVVAETATSRVEIHGELWSRPFDLALTPSAEQAKLDAALVFGSPLVSELSEPEEMTLAMLGRAVSPVTSYLAIEPGVRPSTEGLDWNEIGEGWGEGGGGFGSGIGLGQAGRIGRTNTKNDEWLKGSVTAALRRCSPSSDGVSVTLETTMDEVVDVTNVALSPSRDAKSETCVREAVWGFTLPGSFDEWFLERSVAIKL